ncbi:MAG: glutamate-1-semialdehyde 2,1-aminomutase [Syntrophomonadaceae bacterium]|nr:glutamate-1-semialdehyde 2,1-aminomutase [Syntrophomonadaceae bacterium]
MSNNNDYQSKAHCYIPGGAHTYSRGDDQYPVNAPPVLARGEGAYVWDVDGNKYLDYGMALRAVTLGYAYERINQAAIAEINKGNNLTRASQTEIDAAEAMVKLIDGMDMVKFAKNGSTVTTAAIKLARAYTDRKYIARCAEHPFFSYDDWFIGDTVMQAGVPSEISELTLQFHFNDISSLKELFARYPNQIAGVIMEAATTVEPGPGFLKGVQELCKANQSVFILDEMITGFRWDLKGAQNYYGVVPDLCTFGKGMANGFSVAALMGKKEIMELGGLFHSGKRVFLISTTHGAEMCGLGALNETIKAYQDLDVVKYLWSYGEKLMGGMNSIARELGIADYFKVEGVPVSPGYVCLDKEGQISPEFRTLFAQEMLRQGVLMPWIAISYSHRDQELDISLEATRQSLLVYRKALEAGIERYMLGRAVKPVFRKYN